MSSEHYITMRTGAKMPRLLLGTWKSPAEKTKLAVKTALESGYRGVDCANDYDNEPAVGEAIKEFLADNPSIKREDLYVQVKLWNSNHRPIHVGPDLDATLSDLGLDYVDCFVLHWPMACPAVPGGDKPGETRLRPGGCYPDHYSKGTMFPLADDGHYCTDNSSHFTETWNAMEELVDQGKAKSIGLSNFNLTQVKEVLSCAKKHLPVVLQNESHPYLQERDLRDFCRINNIIFQSYSSLGSGDRPWRQAGSITSGAPSGGHEVLAHPTIKALADRLGRTPAQVVLRWHLQIGGAAVAKSVTPDRIRSNFGIWDFELTSEDLASISDLNFGWRHLMWAETSSHPDYPFKDWLPAGYVTQKPGKGSTAGAT